MKCEAKCTPCCIFKIVMLAGCVGLVGSLILYFSLFREEEHEIEGPACATEICFSEEDDTTCRQNYMQIESSWSNSYEYYRQDREELEGLYSDILTQMQTYDIGLVDNNEYLFWCVTYVSPEASCDGQRCSNSDKPVFLDGSVRSMFYTSFGATTITDVARLTGAMETMFWFRTTQGFDDSMAGFCLRRQLYFMVPIDLSGCSQATKESAWEIEGNTRIRTDQSDKLICMRPFLTATANWIRTTYD